MASAERQAEETRIRRILQLNSYQLVTLERYLLQEGHIPDSADEEAARDATYKIYEFSKTPAVKYTPIHCLFDPNWPEFITHAGSGKREIESAKYDALRDLIILVATRKAKALTAQREQEARGADVAVKSEEA
jgi:hypothetical protein